jgi:hypothetical protein
MKSYQITQNEIGDKLTFSWIFDMSGVQILDICSN